jgi:thioredoxin reductase (NADPH)
MHKKTGIIPQQPKQETAKESPVNEVKTEKSKADANPKSASLSALFDEAMLAQLNAVFSRMENPLVLKLYLDARPVSEELRGYMEELSKLTEKLSVDISKRSTEADPCVEVYRQDGSYTGLAFHGVPGGHEFTSFVLGLYNAAGAGQKIDEDAAEAVSAIDHRVDLKVLVSLSCTMCPDLVIAAQKLASLNENITAEVYDLNHFPEIKDQYQVMSVPCLVINDGEKISFGKKNIRQILELI